jgi:hypothetical protein
MGKGAAAASASTAPTLEIPDPLEHSTDAAGTVVSTPSAGGVDDLLAQMAGEEIDRLLAEADAAREEAVAGVTPPLERAAEKAAASPPAEPPTPTLEALEDAGASFAKEIIAGTEGVELELATSAEERSALEMATSSQEPAPVQIDASIFEDPTEETAPAARSIAAHEESALDGSLPFYLKPLEWINAPLAALPDRVRELLGKVALLTFFNAVAVLLYVMIFRKHR